ncbi:unnamed protein product [Didymodactylos carnosus]|uniref:Uncharacterized protein n=1 Tax=Didymodactylos carnosus TaxID=1234261 RepID=A0A814YAX0_9BILA|nr:unnamed protein product [Didymodactylos carnosus]CAF3989690.1 unnamed protein product [Didymodactylos carnosus]
MLTRSAARKSGTNIKNTMSDLVDVTGSSENVTAPQLNKLNLPIIDTLPSRSAVISSTSSPQQGSPLLSSMSPPLCTKNDNNEESLVVGPDVLDINTMTWSKTKYGNAMILIAGYQYVIMNKVESKGITNWRCIIRPCPECLVSTCIAKLEAGLLCRVKNTSKSAKKARGKTEQIRRLHEMYTQKNATESSFLHGQALVGHVDSQLQVEAPKLAYSLHA